MSRPRIDYRGVLTMDDDGSYRVSIEMKSEADRSGEWRRYTSRLDLGPDENQAVSQAKDLLDNIMASSEFEPIIITSEQIRKERR